jgi:hypothetical protein
VLRTADVAVVNLETPVTDNPKAVTRPLLFNAPPAMVRALAAAGVRVVSTGNNHARDQHLKGMLETLRHLDDAGIRHVGTGASLEAAWEPVVMEVKGVRLGFLSFARLLNGFANPEDLEQPHVAYVPYPTSRIQNGLKVEETVERVRQAAALCDVLVVLVHWGTEYSAEPVPEDKKLAQAMIDAGAGAVIGHHPHVLQPVETYTTAAGRKGLIAYSLGNLIANQGRHYPYKPGVVSRLGFTRDSMLLRVTWVRREEGGAVELDEVSAVPLWIENNALTRKRKEARNIQPLIIDHALDELQTQLAELNARPEPTKRKERAALKAERKALESRLELKKHRRGLILKVLPEGVTVAAPQQSAQAETQPAGSIAVQAAP